MSDTHTILRMRKELLAPTLGERIRLLREAANETQDVLAVAVGIDQSNITNYEIGKYQPRKATLTRIAEHYNVAPKDLQYGVSGSIAQNPELEPEDPPDVDERSRWMSAIKQTITDLQKSNFDFSDISPEVVAVNAAILVDKKKKGS